MVAYGVEPLNKLSDRYSAEELEYTAQCAGRELVENDHYAASFDLFQLQHQEQQGRRQDPASPPPQQASAFAPHALAFLGQRWFGGDRTQQRDRHGSRQFAVFYYAACSARVRAALAEQLFERLGHGPGRHLGGG